LARQVPWPRILAEGFAIVVSILLAFAIQAWWESADDRRTEQLYLERLIVDLQSDTALYRFTRSALEDKLTALADVAGVLRRDAEVSDTSAFLQAVNFSAVFGAAAPRGVRATIDDLLNTGRLSVIRSADLRTRITEYYRLGDNWQRRLTPNAGPYSSEVRRLIPWAPFAGATDRGVVDFLVDLDDPDYPPAEMIRRIRASELDQLLTMERSFARYALVAYANLTEAAAALLQELEGM